jgi:4'-phosphopantetheinyl transferase
MRIERMALPEPGEVHVWRVELPAAGGREAARRALREILGGYLGEEPEVVVSEDGKPRLSDPTKLHFNLSHSGSLGLIAVATDIDVGVDVEKIRPRRDLVRLAARWLTDPEAAAIAEADEREREAVFYAAWTRHEARTKCTGAGLSGPPPGPEVVAIELEVDPGYAAALAADAPIFVRRFEFTA